MRTQFYGDASWGGFSCWFHDGCFEYYDEQNPRKFIGGVRLYASTEERDDVDAWLESIAIEKFLGGIAEHREAFSTEAVTSRAKKYL